MLREVKIVLNSITGLSSGNGFGIHIDLTSELVTLNSDYLFIVGTVTDNTGIYVSCNVSLSQTITNLYNNAVNRYAPYSYMYVIQNIDGISIFADLPSVTSSTNYINTTGSDVIVITHNTAVDPPPPPVVEGFDTNKIILSRSPYFTEISPSADFDYGTIDLRIYRGDMVNDYPALPTYSLSKPVIIAGQPKIVFNIAKMVNDFVKKDYTPLGGRGAFTQSTSDSVWVEASITASYLGVTIGSVIKKYLAVDGFGYHVELANPILQVRALTSIRNPIIYANSQAPLYFLTKGLAVITINSIDVPFTYNPDFNNQVIGYVNPSAYIGSEDEFLVLIEYEDGALIRHKYTVRRECVTEVINCLFKNRFGVWQAIPFSKLSKKRLDFQEEEYSGLISSYGQYTTSQHSRKTYNVSGKETILCNTDYLTEEYNEAFSDLLASEQVYLEENGNVLPVNITKKSIDKKTKLANKLIKYTMEFEYSYNVINSVV